MAISSLLPKSTTTTPKHHPHHHQDSDDPNHLLHNTKKKKKKTHHHQQQPPPSKSPSSWEQFKSLLTCRSLAPSSQVNNNPSSSSSSSKSSKLASSCSDLCSFRDVAHNNILVVGRRPDHDYITTLLPSTQHQRSSRGLQLRNLSGCYECSAISEPMRYPMPRTICRCPDCGEVFTKAESLETHQSIRHAVSELGPEDSGRNIVEIIFRSSWIKRDNAHFKIERILKVHNTQRTVSRFEGYRDAVKSSAAAVLLHNTSATATSKPITKKNPRCAADGNELLRFHCATLSCSLGARGSTSLCITGTTATTQSCGVCGILRHGFGKEEVGRGVRTTASSGRAHEGCVGRRRGMLVCRVIAGRVRKGVEVEEEGGGGGYDSMAGGGGKGSMEELWVANPRAILPCFVVVYRMVEGEGVFEFE